MESSGSRERVADFNTGYSIENDLYAGSNIDEKFLNGNEKIGYDELLKNVIEWFAFEVEQFRNKLDYEIGFHPRRICTQKQVQPNFLTSRCFSPPNPLTIQEIESDYKLKIQGKLLFKLFIYYYKDILKNKAAYNVETLFDVCLKFPDSNPYIEKIITEISSNLGITA